MKKILLLVPRLNIGGAETYVKEVALGLKQRGYTVFAASGGGALATMLADNGIKHFWLPIRLSTALAAFMLSRIVKKYGIELIHANSAAAGLTAVKLKGYVNIPVVYTAHGVFGCVAKEMQLNKCDKIICVSEFVRQDALKKGFTANRLVTRYNGIDLAKFKPVMPETKNSLRAEYGIRADAFVLAIVARIKNLHNKGHQDIIDVLAKYEGAKDWQLMVIGAGKGLGKLREAVAKAGIAERVQIIGHNVDVASKVGLADVVVLPSYFETFGLVLAEGMAMEKPAVAYAVGGTPEVIADGKTGYLAKYKDLDDLYNKLSLLANDKLKCEAFGKAARQWVAANFSETQMLDSLIEIYTEVDNEKNI